MWSAGPALEARGPTDLPHCPLGPGLQGPDRRGPDPVARRRARRMKGMPCRSRGPLDPFAVVSARSLLAVPEIWNIRIG